MKFTTGGVYKVKQELKLDSLFSFKLVLADYEHTPSEIQQIVTDLNAKGYIKDNEIVFPKGTQLVKLEDPKYHKMYELTDFQFTDCVIPFTVTFSTSEELLSDWIEEAV